jgi:hypothetical protein
LIRSLARRSLLPLLEAKRAGPKLVAVRLDPVRGAHVEERRLETLEQTRPNIEEACPARAAQILAPGRREDVAADLLDVNRQLPDRLAGIEQVGNPGFARDGADLRRGVDETAVRRHVRDRDELRTLVDELHERIDRDLAVLVVRDRDDLHPGPLGDLKIGDVVAGVFGERR